MEELLQLYTNISLKEDLMFFLKKRIVKTMKSTIDKIMEKITDELASIPFSVQRRKIGPTELVDFVLGTKSKSQAPGIKK